MPRSGYSRLPFPVLFSLRSHLGRSRALSLLTVLAIGTAVALATGLEMSTRSAEAELARTADALAGAAQLEITAGEVGIPDSLLEMAQGVPGVLAASPFLQTTVWIAGDGPEAGQPLRVIGVDFLADLKVRSYRVTREDLEIRDPLLLLADERSIIGTQRLLDRLGIREGEAFAVRSSAGDLELTVRGLLAPEGLGDAFDGQVVAMDVFSLQVLLGREGWFDRIDIVPERGTDLAELEGALAAAVAGFASVRRAASRDILVERTFGTIRLGVLVLAVVGVLVAAFLSYGTMSISVDRRITELAILQATGLEASRVRRLVRVDALLLATIGTAVGLATGLYLSRAFISVFSQISGHLQGIEFERLEMRGSTLLLALLIGVGVSFLATFEPARRATARPPMDVLRVARRPQRTSRRAGVHALVGVGLLAVAGLAWQDPFGLPALLRVGLLFAAGLLLVIQVFGLGLEPVLRSVRPLIERLVPGVGAFVGTALLARPLHTGLTVSALSGVIAGLVAILIVLESVVVSVHDWLTPRTPNEILITAGDPFGSMQAEWVSAESIRRIRETPGVLATLENVNSRVLFRGEEVRLNAQSMAESARYGYVPVLGGEWPQLARALVRGQLAVSEAFSRRFGVVGGDDLRLETPRGAQVFPVAGVFRDYAGTPAGTLKMDLATFERFWQRDGAYSVRVWTDGPSEPVIERIRRRGPQRLFFTRADVYAEYASRMVRRFIDLLYLVGGLTALLAGFAVLSLLLGSVLERRRELSLLRAAGATGRQISWLVGADGLLIAGMGVVAGLCFGLVSSGPMCDIVTDAMGWTLEYSVPLRSIGWILLGAVACVALATLYPASTARGIAAAEVLSAE